MHQEKKMLAHISEDGTRVQTVADHLRGTAVLCGQFAAAFDAQQQGTWLGLLHDIGKYSTKFQKRLQGGEKGGCPIWSNPTGFCYCGTP